MALPQALKIFVKMTKDILNGMSCTPKPMPSLRASSTQACRGATLYITMSPCKECSKLIHQAGITRLVYKNEYKDNAGITFLEKAGVSIAHIPDLDSE